MKTNFKIGDRVLVENRFECEILDIFEYEGDIFAEVIPSWDNSPNVKRVVTIGVIKEI